MDERRTSAPFGLHPRDVVALLTTVCLVSTVVFLHVTVLPWYVAVMNEGGFAMPTPLRAANRLIAAMPTLGLLSLLGWALYLRLRQRPAHPRTLPRVLAALNVVAVVILMAQTSGFVAFARHGFRAVHNIIDTREQAMPPR